MTESYVKNKTDAEILDYIERIDTWRLVGTELLQERKAMQADNAALRKALDDYKNALENKTKRSKYLWSTGSYNYHDYINEGEIRCATELLNLIEQTLSKGKTE
jgi:hypothetical protein